MTALLPADRDRLVSILGMLGSDALGERASAGLLASRMLRERGLQWADVIQGDGRRGQVGSGGAVWTTDLALARRNIAFTRPWEQQFITSIAQRRVLSPKQRVVLAEIATALRARGFA